MCLRVREREVGGEQALFKKLEDHGAVVMQRGGFVCLCCAPLLKKKT